MALLATDCSVAVLAKPNGKLEVLIFEPVTLPLDLPERSQIDNLLGVIRARLEGAGVANIARDKQIRVVLSERMDPSKLKAIRFQISTPGLFEYRSLADARLSEDKKIIEEARTSERRTVLKDGNMIAKWAPRYETASKQPQNHNHLVTRIRRGASEVLMLTSPMDLDGTYLESIEAGKNENGLPVIRTGLNLDGFNLAQQLARENLTETSKSGRRRSLAFVLDGLFIGAAPVPQRPNELIQFQDPSLSEDTARAIVSIANAGVLPCKLREVKQREK